MNWKVRMCTIILMLCVFKERDTTPQTAYSVEKYDHTAAIFYDYGGQLQFYPRTRKYVKYIGLQPIKMRMSQMKPLHMKLNNICTEFHKENWYHFSNCDKGIRYLENRIEIVQKSKQTFEEVTGIPNENYGRRRRGIINSGGYILSWLFGMATQNEVNEYNEKIDKIQYEQLEFINLQRIR